jgi:hypothetical protein
LHGSAAVSIASENHHHPDFDGSTLSGELHNDFTVLRYPNTVGQAEFGSIFQVLDRDLTTRSQREYDALEHQTIPYLINTMKTIRIQLA